MIGQLEAIVKTFLTGMQKGLYTELARLSAFLEKNQNDIMGLDWHSGVLFKSPK